MSEPLATTSHDLSARASRLAQRVAEVLEATCSAESGAPAAAAYLRDWASEAAGRRPDTLQRGPLDTVIDRFSLTPVECDLLLLAGLPEEHEGLASTFRSMHPRAEPRPTVGLAALLLIGPAVDRSALRRLLAGGALIRCGLVQLVGEGTCYERALVPAEQLWEALHGHDAWPASIRRVTIGEPPAGLDGWLELPAVARAVHALGSPEDRVLLLPADDVVGVSRCAALAAASGCALAGGQVSATDRAAIALIAAHAAARAAVPVLMLTAPADGAPATAPPLELDGVPGPVVVCAPPGSVRPHGCRPVLTVPLGPIRLEDHRTAWRAAIPELADLAPQLSIRHPLDPAITAEVAADVRSRRRLPGDQDTDPREVSSAVRNRAGVTLPTGVELATPSVPWQRLVLPVEPASQLRDAVDRLCHEPLVLHDWGFLEGARARRGVRLLFTGPPGTGKSLAAEVVATAVETDLLVVDVSRVVSKWIGETEKNLAAIFDAAERTQAVLFLDEADALFGMRTEISDAHDRYANLETAYLLQRLDRFDGLAVLATNLRQNIDPAFLRRMDFVVEFTVPDENRRRLLWQLHLPPQASLAPDIDLDVLARLYPVAGGWIRNAAIAAAFLAAPSGGPISQRHLVQAMRREYAKAARPFPGPPVAVDGLDAGASQETT